jgi:uncharacterized membrane protein YgcG
MKKIFFFLFLFGLLLGSQVWADTGTYEIQDYRVTLTPRSSGEVEISYYQKWLVTGGHIPWITVGTPNSNFVIVPGKNKGAVKTAKPVSESGWSGVRIDLDKDYLPKESFEVWFSIVQKGLFYADEKNYRMDFVPGWYDRAKTNNLTLEIVCFAKLDQIQASPAPTSKKDQSIIWEKKNLKNGERFEIKISFPKTLVKMDESQIRKTGNASDSGVFILILIVIVIVVLIVLAPAFFGDSDGDDSYSGGGYSGGIFGSSGRSSSGGGRSSGGGGGFGGRSSSCACACVSCACACACAGGGGAGCSRKIEHTCPLCRNKEKRQRQKIKKFFFFLLLTLFLTSCTEASQYDANTEVPKGDPSFVPLGQYWVIDSEGLLEKETVVEADMICERLKEDGLAEMVVLVKNGIKQPEKYATNYGRWLGLGKKGASTEGGNNGIVWLIRPDAQEKMTISVGRGLPRFTAVDYGAVMEKAKDYINFNNYDAGILTIVEETEKQLRTIYQKGGKK